MSLDSLLEYLSKNPGVLAAVLSIAVALFGCYFGLIEYYSKKAFYDYYFVPDYARDAFRIQFNPDFALYGLGAVSFAASVWFALLPLDAIIRLFILAASGGIVAGLLASSLFRVFLRGLNDSIPGWSGDSLKADSKKFGWWAACTWVSCVLLYAVAWTILSAIEGFPELPALAVCVIVCGVAIPLLVYNWAKCSVPYWHKTLQVVDPEGPVNVAGFTGYAILASTKDIHYCVRIKMIEPHVKVEMMCNVSVTKPVTTATRMEIIGFGELAVSGIPTPLKEMRGRRK